MDERETRLLGSVPVLVFPQYRLFVLRHLSKDIHRENIFPLFRHKEYFGW